MVYTHSRQSDQSAATLAQRPPHAGRGCGALLGAAQNSCRASSQRQPLSNLGGSFFPHAANALGWRGVRPKAADTQAVRISEPGDACEREADAAAERVLQPRISRVGEATSNRIGTPIQAPRPAEDGELRRQPEVEWRREEKPLIGEGDEGAVDDNLPEPDERIEAPPPAIPAGPAEPLDTSLQNFFAPRFGHAFSDVQVHRGAAAAESARAVRARAYTVGNHVVFGHAQYEPASASGLHLLAHELAHVVQQDPSRMTRGPREDGQTVGMSHPRLLQRWSVDGPAVPGLNTIVCNGSGGIRVQLGNTGNADQTRCLSDCMQSHEESHRADALAANHELCKDKASGSQVNTAAGTEQKATEIKASNAELACLRPQVPRVGEVCKRIIEARIRQMEAYRDSFS